MTIDPKGLEKTGTSPERVLGQYGVTETRFHQALDGLGILSFHYDVRVHSDVSEEAIDKHSQHGPHGIEQEWDPGQLRHAYRSGLRAPDFAGRRTHNQKFFIKERNDFEILIRNRQRNEAQIEAAVVQPPDGFLGNIHGDADLGFRILLAQLPEVSPVDRSR